MGRTRQQTVGGDLLSVMRIGHAVESIESSNGGMAVAAARFAEALQQTEDCHCVLITPCANEPIVQFDPSIEILHIPEGNSLSRSRTLQRLSEFHETNRFDMIHIHGVWSPFLHHVATHCKKNQIEYILSPHGMLEPWSLRQKWLKKKIAWWLYQKNDLNNASRIHVTAQNEHQSMMDLGFSNLFTVANGVDIYPLQEEKVENHTALFLSRIHHKKGLDLLVNAWGELRKTGSDWKLKIVGPGESEYIAEIKQLVNSLGLSESIEVLPPVYGDEKWRLYRDANLFVLPTHSENFGIVVPEALSMETPVITTTGTPWTNLDALGCGWCIDLSQANLNQAIKRATECSFAELVDRGRQGRNFVVENFSWKRIGNEMKQEYCQLLGNST